MAECMYSGGRAVVYSRAPVVIFAYRRPDHMHLTLNSLMLCKGLADSSYCDGPQGTSEADPAAAAGEVAGSLLGEQAEYYLYTNNLGPLFQVSGCMPDVPESREVSCALFLPLTISWGWAAFIGVRLMWLSWVCVGALMKVPNNSLRGIN